MIGPSQVRKTAHLLAMATVRWRASSRSSPICRSAALIGCSSWIGDEKKPRTWACSRTERAEARTRRRGGCCRAGEPACFPGGLGFLDQADEREVQDRAREIGGVISCSFCGKADVRVILTRGQSAICDECVF